MTLEKDATIYRYLILLLVLLSSACSCNRLFFHPYPVLIQTPAKGNIDYEDVQIQSSDNISLHGWLLKPKVNTKGSILFLHGNAENISTHIRNIYWLPAHGYEVLMIDYRGFGQSQGEPCMPGIIADVEASYHWLKTRKKEHQSLFIIGQSIGASLAAYSVGQHPEWRVDGVVLDSPFASYQQIAKEKTAGFWLTWPFQYPVSWLFSDTYSPHRNINKISPSPLLMFYSTIDQVVSPSHSVDLFSAAKNPKSLVKTEERHIATFNLPENREYLLSFLASNTRD